MLRVDFVVVDWDFFWWFFFVCLFVSTEGGEREGMAKLMRRRKVNALNLVVDCYSEQFSILIWTCRSEINVVFVSLSLDWRPVFFFLCLDETRWVELQRATVPRAGRIRGNGPECLWGPVPESFVLSETVWDALTAGN